VSAPRCQRPRGCVPLAVSRWPEAQLEAEALAAKAPELAPDKLIGGPVLVCLADVEAREIAWLWPGRIA